MRRRREDRRKWQERESRLKLAFTGMGTLIALLALLFGDNLWQVLRGEMPEPEAISPLLGSWQGADAFDQSRLALEIRGVPGAFTLSVSDSAGIACGGGPWSVEDAAASVDGLKLSARFLAQCSGSPASFDVDWILEYETGTDTLYEVCTEETEQLFPSVCDRQHRSTAFRRFNTTP
jgi:hypothetical protein